MSKVAQEILTAMSLIKGEATYRQIHDLMPDVRDDTLGKTLRNMTKKGQIVRHQRDGLGIGVRFCYSVPPAKLGDRTKLPEKPTTNAIAQQTEQRRAEPTAPSPHRSPSQRMAEYVVSLENKVRQLQEWQRAVIAKYPDLYVDPKILKAREIAIAAYRKRNDADMIKKIQMGAMDKSPFMEIALAAMEE